MNGRPIEHVGRSDFWSGVAKLSSMATPTLIGALFVIGGYAYQEANRYQDDQIAKIATRLDTTVNALAHDDSRIDVLEDTVRRGREDRLAAQREVASQLHDIREAQDRTAQTLAGIVAQLTLLRGPGPGR